jgi:hypothetical protein
VLSDAQSQYVLAERRGAWVRDHPVLGTGGEPFAHTWRCDDGSVFVPFDPDEVVVNFWSERYAQILDAPAQRRLRRALMVAYYRIRPLTPRTVQIAARRRFARVQARTRFPRWPVETALHDFFDFLFETLAALCGEPVPRIAAWPHGHRWALVLTHDVEHAAGWAAREPVVELEREHGVRSCWNLVPRRYDVDIRDVRRLQRDGFEIGVHGLHHDGRDLESVETVRKRLPEMRQAAFRWQALGFRAPAMHRDWRLTPRLEFEYDSSYPDTDPFEPQAGGCCAWLPFFIGRTVELPLTLPQDHTLFVILRHGDESAWVEKAEFLRDRGGLALIDTHPDYLVDERILRAYAHFLGRFAEDEGAWRALPREVSAWWRSRAESRLVPERHGWRIVGPASEAARVELVG